MNAQLHPTLRLCVVVLSKRLVKMTRRHHVGRNVLTKALFILSVVVLTIYGHYSPTFYLLKIFIFNKYTNLNNKTTIKY